MQSLLRRSMTAAAAATLTLACSSGGGDTPGSGPDAPPERATAQAIVSSQLTGGAGCSDAHFSLGQFDPATPVPDRASVASGAASVECRVDANGDHFDVTARASAAGRGSIEIAGRLATREPAGAMDVVLIDANGARLERAACQVAYATLFQGIAEGRVWGTLACGTAAEGAPPTSCGIRSQFRFENCL